MNRILARDLIVYVPGITGSSLLKDGKALWDASLPTYIALCRKARLRKELEIRGDDDGALDDLGDGITAGEVIELPFVVPGLVKSVGPRRIQEALGDSLDLEPASLTHPGNFHLFAYDWRRSNRHSAKRLRAFVEPLLKRWRTERYPEAEVILIAHSMGGLVSRYYAEVLNGWHDCKAIFTLGTPHRGSISIADYLANGYREKGLDLSDTVRSLASAHELLPREAVVSIDGTWRTILDAQGLPFDRKRVESASAFHKEIAMAVADHRENATYARWLNVRPCVGWGQKTPQWLAAESGRLIARFESRPGVPAAVADGDGRVPRLFAIPSEFADGRETYVPDSHAGVQRNAFLLQHVVQHIVRMQLPGATPTMGAVRHAGAQTSVEVEVEDVYLASEEAIVTITAQDPMFSKYRMTLETMPDRSASEKTVVDTAGSVTQFSLGRLRPGLYGVTVESDKIDPQAPPAVFEMFNVAGEL